MKSWEGGGWGMLFPLYSGLTKVAGCWGKLPPTRLVSAGYAAWHFFTDGVY